MLIDIFSKAHCNHSIQLKLTGLHWIKLVNILKFFTISRLIETKHY